MAVSKQNMLEICYERFGHINFRAVINASKLCVVRDFEVEEDCEFLLYNVCNG